ncbi:MAG TPA: hypothetical protein PKL46_13640, partial [Aquabacterium sp.]|nr:hypothetical protein [Aquabacterium sp.]
PGSPNAESGLLRFIANQEGFFLDKGGYEYALALFAASVSLLFTGGGRFSADAALVARAEGGR